MRAFSLVELSIVLVILGLLTGGILTGQSLIRAAELRSYHTDIGRTVTAAQSFYTQYMALPGDMADATRLWGHASGITSCINNSGVTTTSPGACDGNDNRQITYTVTANVSSEHAQFWRHLGLAGLYEGSFAGTTGPTTTNRNIPGENCPATRIGSQSCWRVVWLGSHAGVTDLSFAGEYGNVIYPVGLGSGLNTGTVFLRPDEAWNIDIKMDDGKPATGSIRSSASVACSGTSDVTATAAQYNVSTSGVSCMPYFVNAF